MFYALGLFFSTLPIILRGEKTIKIVDPACKMIIENNDAIVSIAYNGMAFIIPIG